MNVYLRVFFGFFFLLSSFSLFPLPQGNGEVEPPITHGTNTNDGVSKVVAEEHQPGRPPVPGGVGVGWRDPAPKNPKADSGWCTGDMTGSDGQYCHPNPPKESEPEPATPSVTLRDAAQLIAQGSGLNRQPTTPVVRTDPGIITYTSSTPQSVSTTLLGHSVTMTARPYQYTWDWGDGNTTVTRSPGGPYPNHDPELHHLYHKRYRSIQVSLTTLWQVSYTIDGGAPVSIPGHLTTQEVSTPFRVVTINSVLTDDDEESAGH